MKNKKIWKKICIFAVIVYTCLLYTSQFSTKEEKQQYCVEYIRENKADFFNAEHLRKKASYNFANGNLGASAFLNAVSYTHLDVYKRQAVS